MINKKMTIGELVRNYPETVDVLFEFGMGCVGCPSAQSETIEEACDVHNLNIENLMESLTKAIK